MTNEITGDMPAPEELETSEESLPEKTEPVDDESAEEEEPKVPLSRLRKETEKRRSLESKLNEFEEKLSKVEKGSNITNDEEKKARDYLKNMIKETWSELREAEKREQAQQDSVFKETFAEIKESYPEMAKNEKAFLKFHEEGRFEDNVNGLWGAAKIFSEMKKTGGTTIKPKLPSGARTSDKIKNSYNIKGKDIYQIIADAKEEGKSAGQL